jgi:3-oxoacyl-(acyl-carrier-protein) synthase
VQNDELELRAIEESVGGAKPALYSHKGALGHSLGAAGLVSVVINRMCHKNGVVPPLVATEPIASSAVNLFSRPHKTQIHRSLAIAAGFGGAMGVVSLVSR